MTPRKQTERKPSGDDRDRVRRARDAFGLRAIASRAEVSTGAVLRVIAGEAVKSATLTVVVQAADSLESERSRKLQSSDTRGAA